MSEPERIRTLRRLNESQPCGMDSWGFPVGQFARELDQLRRANAVAYAKRIPGNSAKRVVRR